MGSNGIFMVRMITVIYYNGTIIWDQDYVYCLFVMIYIYIIVYIYVKHMRYIIYFGRS